MATGSGRDVERFAAAVEHGRTQSALGDPSDESLERELELVAMLREARASLAPTPDASARMRARVMAAATTMIPAPQTDSAEPTGAAIGSEPRSTAVLASAVDQDNVVSIASARGRHRFPRRAVVAEHPRRRSALGVSAAAALMLIAVTGGGAMFSQSALPGDTLYGFKQTTESGLVALAPEGSKAERQLDVASNRIDEVQALNASNRASADRGTDISQALSGFNEQTTAASRTWLTGQNSTDSTQLENWAETQSGRLAAMRSQMPASSQSDADASMRTLEQVRTRADALNSRRGCDKVTTGEYDEFGPIPAKGPCTAMDASAQADPDTSTSQRSGGPSLGSPGRTESGQPPANGDATRTGPDLHLPDLSGGRNGSLLPNRESTNGPTAPQPPPPGLNLPLLDGN